MGVRRVLASDGVRHLVCPSPRTRQTRQQVSDAEVAGGVEQRGRHGGEAQATAGIADPRGRGDQDGQRALVDSIALKRLGAPEDIAYGVLFFASDRAGWITGQVISIDGGK